MSLFVDTSAWFAAADRGDRSHGRATKILRTDESLVTTDHVLVESFLLIRARLGERAALRFWDGLRSGASAIEPVNGGDLEAAWAIAQSFSDQGFSIVDCTSFAVMVRLGLHRAASFDRDFAVFRFGPGRKRGFEVLR